MNWLPFSSSSSKRLWHKIYWGQKKLLNRWKINAEAKLPQFHTKYTWLIRTLVRAKAGESLHVPQITEKIFRANQDVTDTCSRWKKDNVNGYCYCTHTQKNLHHKSHYFTKQQQYWCLTALTYTLTAKTHTHKLESTGL